MNKQQLQQEIEALQKQLEEKQKALESMTEKWEPKDGRFVVLLDGRTFEMGSICCDRETSFGVVRQTREQAEKAAKAMRAHNRLLAYVAEFAPDWEPDWDDAKQRKTAVAFDGERYEYWDYVTASPLGVVTMPTHIAEELAAKLNSGEVEL